MAGYELKKHEKALLINLTATEHEPALRTVISEARRLREENKRLENALRASRLGMEEKDRINGELYREREMLQLQVECLEDRLAQLAEARDIGTDPLCQRIASLERQLCQSAAPAHTTTPPKSPADLNP